MIKNIQDENNVQIVCLKKLEDLKIKKAVDLGAGNGFLYNSLKKRGIDIVASDIKPLFKECKKADYNKGLPYKNSQFDCIICLGVIESVDNPFFLLKEIKRIAKPGATIFISTQNNKNIFNRIYYLFTGIPLYAKIYADHKAFFAPRYVPILNLYFKKLGLNIKETYYNKGILPFFR
ncbi:MAG: class I SAM-dependent methyltransferase, partial [Candidatus Pacearchaeota archaeon]